MDTTVAVIGAGNGGTAISAYLASCGVKVNLCDLFPQYLEGIQAAGGIDLTYDGQTSHQAYAAGSNHECASGPDRVSCHGYFWKTDHPYF